MLITHCTAFIFSHMWTLLSYQIRNYDTFNTECWAEEHKKKTAFTENYNSQRRYKHEIPKWHPVTGLFSCFINSTATHGKTPKTFRGIKLVPEVCQKEVMQNLVHLKADLEPSQRLDTSSGSDSGVIAWRNVDDRLVMGFRTRLVLQSHMRIIMCVKL